MSTTTTTPVSNDEFLESVLHYEQAKEGGLNVFIMDKSLQYPQAGSTQNSKTLVLRSTFDEQKKEMTFLYYSRDIGPVMNPGVGPIRDLSDFIENLTTAKQTGITDPEQMAKIHKNVHVL